MTSRRFIQIFVAALIVCATSLNAQSIATLEVQVDPNGTAGIPFSIQLDDITTVPDSMNEVLTVNTWCPSTDYYYVDITSRLSCATDAPVVLLEYRYGGLGWRTTGEWDNKNSEVITSEGKARKEADGSRARWCIVQGTLGSDYGGAIMMSHPTNYNHPEPLRIWPENQYDRGDMFANFSPTKDRDWNLEPGKSYLLRYRFVVFNGKMTKEKAEEAWKHFANSPRITVKLN